MKITVTGSGGIGVAQWLQCDFQQEVIACTRAVEEFINKTDVVIELGGEDAKNSLTLPKPATDKYEVYFNAGEGHVIGKKGPALTAGEKAKWDKATASFDFGEWKELMMEK